jgi:pimeloyl-ACP methyl ester carboxylesterase
MVVMVGGVGQASDSHDYAVPTVSKSTRTCVYDRAFGRAGSKRDDAVLRERVSGLRQVLAAADPGPYVLVGRSEGGHTVTEYAYAHPKLVAGIVLIDTPCPPPRPQRHVGDIPIAVVSVHYGRAARSAAERSNALDQRGWLALSPRSHQVIADSGPEIEEDNPDVVIDRILETVAEAR